MKLQDKLSQILLILVGVALFATNGMLLYQNFQLRRALETSKQFVTEKGYKFSSLPGVSLNGISAPLVLEGQDKQTLFLVFSSKCEYCLQQYPHWKSLLARMDRSRWNIIGVTADSDAALINEHLEENGLSGLPVHMIASEEMRRARLGFTPMTVAVDVTGEVIDVWAGLTSTGFESLH